MKLLVINGSPKGEKSNTLRLTRAFVEGIRSVEEVECTELTVREKNIRSCAGCFGCWNKTPGVCVIKDDMKEILDQILQADVIIWSFGLYYFNVPGILKLLIDRQLPMALPFMSAESESGGHPSRFDMSGKRHVIVSTCGFFTAKGNYGSVDAMFDHFLGKNHYERIYCGQGELFSVEALHQRTEEYRQIVRQAGIDFAAGGISSSTRQKLEQLLFPRETFEAMADASWGISREDGKKEDETLIFTRQMAALYRKSSYPGKDIILEMNYTDKNKRYQILLTKDGAEFRTEDFTAPTTTILTPFTVWQDIAAGKIGGAQAMMQQLYRVEGDFDLMLHWDTYFGADGTSSSAPESDSVFSRKGTNMLILLIPWITFWIAAAIDSFAGALISIGTCALTGLIFFRHRKTIYDVLTTVAVTGASLLLLLLPAAAGYILPCSYLAFGLLWSCSCVTKIPLSAWYSMNEYNGEEALDNPLFIHTNRILTLCWGILYLLTALWTFFLMGSPLAPYLVIINNITPIFMGIFTKWFQNWYPAHYAAGGSKS